MKNVGFCVIGDKMQSDILDVNCLIFVNIIYMQILVVNLAANVINIFFYIIKGETKRALLVMTTSQT